MPLPVPWIGPGRSCDAADLDKIAKAVSEHASTGQHAELAEVLRLVMARTAALPDGLDVPRHVRCAQAMLEMAVEWRMPDVERWAVAWLAAAGGTHLRLRWSSRSRDGRSRQEAVVPDRILSVTADEGRGVLGLASGAVVSWTDGVGQSPVIPATGTPASPGSPAWAVAVRGQRVVAAGLRNWLATSGWPIAPPAPLPPLNGLKAVAIGSAGEIVIGDERGRVQLWMPGEATWTLLCAGSSSEVLAVTFAGDPMRSVRCVWASGAVSEIAMAGRPGDWDRLHTLDAPVEAAAWRHDGTTLAAAVGSTVWHVSLRADGTAVAAPLWSQDGVHAIAWSTAGVLASAGLDQIYCATGPLAADASAVTYRSITNDGLIDQIALPGRDHVLSVLGDHLVQWELSGAGSDDPTFFARDPITAVGIRPGDLRHTLVGTERGHLFAYDAAGMAGELGRLSSRSKIKELTWFEHGECWLVGAVDGLYTFRPVGSGTDSGDEPTASGSGIRLARGLCDHVAASRDRFAYAIGDQITTSDSRTFRMDGLVLDLCFDYAGGALAAIDDAGRLLVHEAGHESTEILKYTPDTRLLAARGNQRLLRDPGKGVHQAAIRWTARRGDRRYTGLPAGFSVAVPYDGDRIVVTYPGEGVLLTGTGSDDRSWAPAQVTGVALSERRIAVATTHHVAGFDVLTSQPVSAGSHAGIRLTARSADNGYEVMLPGASRPLPLSVRQLGGLGRDKQRGLQVVSQTIEELSDAVYRAGQLGDLLWRAGLDLAIDHARGPDPNRPVLLAWDCPPGDLRADSFPWELLHPSTGALGWFSDPPVTTVRIVAAAADSRNGQLPRPGAGQEAARGGETPTMLVLRGTDDRLQAVDQAFDRFRRRTRRTRVRLLKPRPQEVGSATELTEALRDQVDILQLWAHSGDEGVLLAPGQDKILTGQLADLIARAAPRLVVLVGCSSGALGRAVVGRGVPAAVAMRVPVYDHTIQPLVEDVTAAVLAGTRVDLAFAQALRTYLHTGQPGAAAVPMLYLAETSDGVLFSDFADPGDPANT